MHLKSTDHRPAGQLPRHKCSPPPPPIFRGRNGAAAMTRGIATLALAGAVLGMLLSTVQAQERDEVLQSVSEGDTDLPNDNTTPGRVAVGGSATGAIGIPKDQDRFAVNLEAGRTYRFDLTGRPGGGGTLPDTYFRAIYNSEGRYQSGSYNDDFDGGRDSRVTFTPTQSGTYYARVSGDRNETGTYTLSVTDVTPELEDEGQKPAKPRGLEATATHGQVVLTWDDPDDDSITGYMILRRVRVNDTGGDFDVLVADTGTAATTYTDDSVAASLTYTYRIKAINEHGVSERSRWVHIDTPAAPVAKPRGLSDRPTARWSSPGDWRDSIYVMAAQPGYGRQGTTSWWRTRAAPRPPTPTTWRLALPTPTASRPSTSTGRANARAGSTSTPPPRPRPPKATTRPTRTGRTIPSARPAMPRRPAPAGRTSWSSCATYPPRGRASTRRTATSR